MSPRPLHPIADLPTLSGADRAALGATLGTGPAARPQSAVHAIPAVIAGYRRVRLLGAGGMGEVHLAHHPRLHREVALKLLRQNVAADAAFAQRFLRESQAMAAVSHPNVVAIHDAGESDGFLFMAIEFVDGTDLNKLLRTRGTIDEATALRLMIGCCRGLEAIHAAGLVHRDLKPANIFLDRRGEPKIGDLGLARHVDGEDRMTMTGSAWGTPAYMPPEQVRGVADIDIRCDVYALGATLFTILTGSEPFTGPTSFVITSRILSEPAPDPRQLNRTVSAPLAAIVRTCLTKERDERYQDPQALRLDLERARDGQPLLIAQVIAGSPAPATPAAPLGGAQPRRAAGAAGAPVTPPSGWMTIDPLVLKVLVYGAMLGLLGLVVWSLQGQTTAPGKPGQLLRGVAPTGESPPPGLTSRPWMRSENLDRFGPWATLALGPSELRFRRLPAQRSFMMGSPADEPDRQEGETTHPVTLSTAAWIGETEITRRVWQEVTGQAQPGDPNLPVAGVSWYEARDFLAALNQRQPGLGARLPSEAEWEQACRGGSSLAFSLGPQADASDWLARPGKGPRPVAQGRPNAWGLFDVHGNVREWCSDAYDREMLPAGRAETDPENRFGNQNVLRGGSSELPARAARCAARDGADPQDRPQDAGFRILIPDPTQAPP